MDSPAAAKVHPEADVSGKGIHLRIEAPVAPLNQATFFHASRNMRSKSGKGTIVEIGISILPLLGLGACLAGGIISFFNPLAGLWISLCGLAWLLLLFLFFLAFVNNPDDHFVYGFLLTGLMGLFSAFTWLLHLFSLLGRIIFK